MREIKSINKKFLPKITPSPNDFSGTFCQAFKEKKKIMSSLHTFPDFRITDHSSQPVK